MKLAWFKLVCLASAGMGISDWLNTQAGRMVPTSLCNRVLIYKNPMLTYISDLITAANVGIMLFFSVAVAPTIFMVLPPEWSAAYVRKFFPKYFLFLGLTSAVAAALHDATFVQIALAGCSLIFFFSVFWLTPRINLARDNKQEKTFKVMHYTSVGLNLVQLAIFIWVLVKSIMAA